MAQKRDPCRMPPFGVDRGVLLQTGICRDADINWQNGTIDGAREREKPRETRRQKKYAETHQRASA